MSSDMHIDVFRFIYIWIEVEYEKHINDISMDWFVREDCGTFSPDTIDFPIYYVAFRFHFSLKPLRST